jgi:hypothetical protein
MIIISLEIRSCQGHEFRGEERSRFVSSEGIFGDRDLSVPSWIWVPQRYKVNRPSIESSFPIHHHQITNSIFDPRSHSLSPLGFESLNDMERNSHDGPRISVKRSNMDFSAVVDSTPLNYANSLKMRGSIGKFATFEISWESRDRCRWASKNHLDGRSWVANRDNSRNQRACGE